MPEPVKSEVLTLADISPPEYEKHFRDIWKLCVDSVEITEHLVSFYSGQPYHSLV